MRSIMFRGLIAIGVILSLPVVGHAQDATILGAVTDADLKDLADLKQLTTLRLDFTQVTDDVGTIQGALSSGGSTDDTVLAVKVTLPAVSGVQVEV